MAATITSVIGITAMSPAEEDSLSLLLSRSWLRVGGTFDAKPVWLLWDVCGRRMRGVWEVPGPFGGISEISESVGVVWGSVGETSEAVD